MWKWIKDSFSTPTPRRLTNEEYENNEKFLGKIEEQGKSGVSLSTAVKRSYQRAFNENYSHLRLLENETMEIHVKNVLSNKHEIYPDVLPRKVETPIIQRPDHARGENVTVIPSSHRNEVQTSSVRDDNKSKPKIVPRARGEGKEEVPKEPFSPVLESHQRIKALLQDIRAEKILMLEKAGLINGTQKEAYQEGFMSSNFIDRHFEKEGIITVIKPSRDASAYLKAEAIPERDFMTRDREQTSRPSFHAQRDRSREREERQYER